MERNWGREKDNACVEGGREERHACVSRADSAAADAYEVEGGSADWASDVDDVAAAAHVAAAVVADAGGDAAGDTVVVGVADVVAGDTLSSHMLAAPLHQSNVSVRIVRALHMYRTAAHRRTADVAVAAAAAAGGVGADAADA